MQTVYRGNYSLMRKHISRSNMETHYNIYRMSCIQQQVSMHELAMPPQEKERIEQLEAGVSAEEK